ncbi:hypothetical protein ACIRVK_39040 [Streptomyces sp. NPDC101152]|uniref:hypothetical protein n=1 Tax=Streptomyces sp. NPDC101152 TaxID=3366116 RepID=UPI0037FEB14B
MVDEQGDRFDVAVLGGYVAAIRAAQLGKRAPSPNGPTEASEARPRFAPARPLQQLGSARFPAMRSAV